MTLKEWVLQATPYEIETVEWAFCYGVYEELYVEYCEREAPNIIGFQWKMLHEKLVWLSRCPGHIAPSYLQVAINLSIREPLALCEDESFDYHYCGGMWNIHRGIPVSLHHMCQPIDVSECE